MSHPIPSTLQEAQLGFRPQSPSASFTPPTRIPPHQLSPQQMFHHTMALPNKSASPQHPQRQQPPPQQQQQQLQHTHPVTFASMPGNQQALTAEASHNSLYCDGCQIFRPVYYFQRERNLNYNICALCRQREVQHKRKQQMEAYEEQHERLKASRFQQYQPPQPMAASHLPPTAYSHHVSHMLQMPGCFQVQQPAQMLRASPQLPTSSPQPPLALPSDSMVPMKSSDTMTKIKPSFQPSDSPSSFVSHQSPEQKTASYAQTSLPSHLIVSSEQSSSSYYSLSTAGSMPNQLPVQTTMDPHESMVPQLPVLPLPALPPSSPSQPQRQNPPSAKDRREELPKGRKTAKKKQQPQQSFEQGSLQEPSTAAQGTHASVLKDSIYSTTAATGTTLPPVKQKVKDLNAISINDFIAALKHETVFLRKQYLVDITPLLENLTESAGFTQLGRAICERVLEGTTFNFSLKDQRRSTKHPNTLSTLRYYCSQRADIAKARKMESGKMSNRYTCSGALTMIVDLVKRTAQITLIHKQPHPPFGGHQPTQNNKGNQRRNQAKQGKKKQMKQVEEQFKLLKQKVTDFGQLLDAQRPLLNQDFIDTAIEAFAEVNQMLVACQAAEQNPMQAENRYTSQYNKKSRHIES
ncbi:uncharacterized protein BYT42DRAFT_174165 [Radiomyces spectabilis]|uniref:uncharacterized protein n=1 Tax=Radiomyces spectabilis TaxID=64574 RepID=UPI002220BBBE|nr:uncharacterized protein BYT42DRAFT_174165 [Radiomyces spectabilis]KAI8390904.1 hypothetical protein BYT42DRAFT_174165 [Radiomyces spectabilis]